MVGVESVSKIQQRHTTNVGVQIDRLRDQWIDWFDSLLGIDWKDNSVYPMVEYFRACGIP